MYDKEFALDILNQILESTQKVSIRFKPIKRAEDFTNSPEGMEKLDAICMQLIAIGESLKRIDKITNRSLLKNYPQVDWKGGMGLRDVITHHYFDIDAEEIFLVCKKYIPILFKTVKKMIGDIR